MPLLLFVDRLKQAGLRCPFDGMHPLVFFNVIRYFTSIIHIFYKILQYSNNMEQARSSEKRQVFRLLERYVLAMKRLMIGCFKLEKTV